MRRTERRVRTVEDRVEGNGYQPIVVEIDRTAAETRHEEHIDSRGRRVIRIIYGADDAGLL